MAKNLDLTGKKFGRWSVIKKQERRGLYGSVPWLCQCDCGVQRDIVASTLVDGRSRSCGCWKSEKARTHGKSRTAIYELWSGMLKRCSNTNSEQYANYGGRGIQVCERWKKFENFYADMGECPAGHSLDRIDNNGNYEPRNCRWATQKQQVRNKQNTFMVEFEGKQIALAELCERHGLPLKRTRNRIVVGWPLEEALNPNKVSRWHR